MGVVIEICVKYPGGRTRMTVADIIGGTSIVRRGLHAGGGLFIRVLHVCT